MTPRMSQTLDFVKDYWKDYWAVNGYAPSYDEIMDSLGLRSKSGVYRIVHALEDRGFVTITPYAVRSIEPVMRCFHCPHCGRKL